ncbi:MAG: metal ABC transporter substrate-binding protein [Phycisphaerales bacterium]
MRSRPVIIVGGTAVLALVACDSKPQATTMPAGKTTPASAPPSDRDGQAEAARPLKVVVSIPPLKGLVEPLLPAGSTIEVLIPPGASEHGYELPPQKLAAASMADLIITVGLGLEPQIEKFMKDRPRAGRKEVRFADVPGLSLPGADKHAGHDHKDHDHDHDHTIDPHLWLDPVAAKSLVGRLGEVLGVAPAAAKQQQRIDQVDAAYRSTLGAAKRRTIVVAHDAYGHLAKRYGLEVIALSGLNAGEPKPADLKKAADVMRDKGLTTIFIEPQLGRAPADRLAAALNAKVAVLDPLGDGDWFALMDKNLVALAAALDAPPPTRPPAAMSEDKR